MTTTPITILCDSCDTKLKVKPGLLKVMKTIKCTKCKHPIKVSNIKIEAPVRKKSHPKEPVPQPQPKEAAITPQNFALLNTNIHVVEADTSVAVTPEPQPEPKLDYELENQNLREQLSAAQQEISEMNERVGSLQELWQSKEMEVRELAGRLKNAEEEARKALSVRDDILSEIKQELGLFLVEERDAALKRFADMENKLMGRTH